MSDAPELFAFPHPSGAQGCDGMTLRDYFAAAALTGLLSRPKGFLEAPFWAYDYADAMLAERAKK
jgi:hypothetical protein